MYKVSTPANYLDNGVSADTELLKGFVPMAEMSDSHLKSAARISRVVTVPESQTIADRALLSSHYIYLLNGKISIKSQDPSKQAIYDAADHCVLPLGLLFEKAPLIVANTDCQILMVDRNELESMLCWDQVAKSLMIEISAERDLDEDREWMQTLLMSNLFHKIPPYNIRRVVDRFEARVVQSGDNIIRQNDRGDECYIIKEGTAIVIQGEENTSSEKVVAELHAGQCFGEEALVNMTVRNATVRMTSNGVLMALKKREFLALMSEPEIKAVPILKARDSVAKGGVWLDVRSQPEFEHKHHENAFHLPLHLMSLKSRLMDKEKHYFAYCSTGRRAITAAYLLAQQGFNITPVIPQSEPQLRSL